MVTVGKEEIFVQDSGSSKPALLFVHGIMMDHTVWKHQVAEFSADHRVVCMDLRGYGRSSAASPDISFEDHSDDIAAVIDKLGLQDVTFVGWSMGGAIAQVFATRHPDRISRLALVDTTPQLLADDTFAHALPVEAAQQLGALLAQDFKQGCAAFCGMIAPENPDVAAMLTGIAASCRPDVAFAAFRSGGGRSLLDKLPGINTPTSVLAGANDLVCLPEASRYLAAHIPGAKGGALFIEGAGHAPFLTAPERFNALLRSALRASRLQAASPEGR
jgi:pimeloyl-ACP methyl ester carboxylesterase